MKYDIFISYRRKGGSERAELLKAILEKRGYKGSRVFMDTHSYYWIGESNPNDASFAKELLFGIGQINIESGKKSVGRSIRAVYIKD